MHSRILPILISFILILTCKPPKSEVDLEMTAIQGLLNGNIIVFYLGEIDMDKTPDCGRASFETASQSGGGTTPSNDIKNTGGGGTTANDRFSIISTFNMKQTYETLNLRFSYDRRQFKGSINPQQGFSLTGGFFGNTVTGRRGTVEWGSNGISLDPKASNQQLRYMEIDVNLTGTFVPGQGTSTPPGQCFTQDGVNCTSVTTSTQCFTTDNRTCLADTSSSESSKEVIIRGKIKCNAPNII
jgi:hypothetical protein